MKNLNNVKLDPVKNMPLSSIPVEIEIDSITQLVLDMNESFIKSPITCSLLEIPDKVYKFSISTDPNSEDIITFDQIVTNSELLFTRSIQYHNNQLYFLEDGKVSLHDPVSDTITRLFDLNDPEDSIRHLLFMGNYEVIITNRRILTLRNFEIEDDMTVKDTTKIFGVAISPNKCCLCLVTCNKLFQMTESELKV